jgi:outer membrane immunogenic protein
MKYIAVLLAALFAAGTAYAADLPGSTKDGAYIDQSSSVRWSGFYIGGTAGFGVGDTESTIEGISIADYQLNGAIYGGYAGVNMQRGNIVFGLEAGINGTKLSGEGQIVGPLLTSERELDWYATAVARLGYASGKTLFYGFGGVAYGDVTTKLQALGSTVAEQDEEHIGWTAGLGLEHALSDGFVARLEYSHVDLGEADGLFAADLNHDVDLKFDAIKVGLGYQLGGSLKPLN